MWFSSWLRNRKRPTSRRLRPAFRPTLEALEGRDVPSTLTVTSSLDYGPGSLRYEISQANAGDTIVFNLGTIKTSKKAAPPPPTITLTGGELEISKSLTIKGQGVAIASQGYETGSLDWVNGSRIFEVDGANTNVNISGMTLTLGGGTRNGGGVTGSPYDGYGGAILNFGVLNLSNCTLGDRTHTLPLGGFGNSAANSGGAIANFGQMTVSGCNVAYNSAYGVTFIRANDGGGGIYNAGTMTVSGSQVVDNSAGTGGGIYNAGTMTVSGCYVQNNSAHTTAVGVVAEGGGIYNAGTAAALTVSNSIFSGNSPDNIFGLYTDGGGNTGLP
jgi:hypothetical protein